MKSITIYIDFKSAASYLALNTVRNLASRDNVAVTWKPYRVRAPIIAEQKDDETKTETHLRVRETQRQLTHLRYALAQGIPLEFQSVPNDSTAALVALLQLDSKPEAFIESAFQAYWRDGLDLDSVDIVRRLLLASGNEQANVGFDEASYQAFDDFQLSSEEQGVFDAPMFVIGEHRFLGREHLPLIENHLDEK